MKLWKDIRASHRYSLKFRLYVLGHRWRMRWIRYGNKVKRLFVCSWKGHDKYNSSYWDGGAWSCKRCHKRVITHPAIVTRTKDSL